MRIAAITNFKHGALFEALRAMSWTQRELAKRVCTYPARISSFSLLKMRPSPQMADRIEKVFVEAGYDFNAQEAWPETFKGFSQRVQAVQVKDVSQLELEAAQGFYQMLELENGEDGSNQEMIEELLKSVDSLPDREAFLIKSKYGIGMNPKTKKQIAQKLDR